MKHFMSGQVVELHGENSAARANRCKVSTHEDEAITGAGETSERGADGADPTVEAKGLEALSTKKGDPETTP